MFRARLHFLLIILILFTGACAQTADTNTEVSDQQASKEIEKPVPPEGDQERDTLFVYLDGQAVKESGFEISQVVSGMARGVDTLALQWASKHCMPVAKFPADWNKYGRGAGHIRNRQMADNADALVAVWDGKSRGTKNMIDTAKAKGLQVYVKQVGVE